MNYEKLKKQDLNSYQALLYDAAIKARLNAYAPITNYKVGSAVLTTDYNVFVGFNVENSALTTTIHAEMMSIYHSMLHGNEKITALCVVVDEPEPAFPCGLCRHVIYDLCGDITIIAGNLTGELRKTTLKELYPEAFRLKQ